MREAEEAECRACGGCVTEEHDVGFERVLCPACGELLLVDGRSLAGDVVEPCPWCKAKLKIVVEPAPVFYPERIDDRGRPRGRGEAVSRAAAIHWDPRAWGQR